MGDPTAFAGYIYDRFTAKTVIYNGIIFNDFIMAISALSRGTTEERLNWIFHLYDQDEDGFITKPDMIRIAKAFSSMMDGKKLKKILRQLAAYSIKWIAYDVEK